MKALKNQKGSTLVVVIVILVAGIVMFWLPMQILFSDHDNVAQIKLQAELTETGNNFIQKRKITREDYEKLYQTCCAITGTPCDVNIQIKVPDNDDGMKTAQVQSNKEGETQYILMTMTQLNELWDEKGTVLLNEGYQLYMSAQETGTTGSESLGKAISAGNYDTENSIMTAEFAGTV